MGNEGILTVPGRYNEIKRICEFVAAGAAEAGFDEDDIFHLELCCDEASTNIIEHAYGQEDAGNIEISYHVSDDEFTIILRDNGRAFDPGIVPPPSTITDDNASAEELASQLRIGGLGLHFIRNLMDEVHFTSDRWLGNQLVMVKKLSVK
ncbi:MAG TPA: ATP-binding protein [Promineifilum sp.]|nr:ATP-binding protein [Promineifilum sp.]HRO24966.1 ATP-binding protein [Promineifilum sp.]HRO90346.1 ATP-binding protein [Promineifilum sp.]HRQ14577.1 ATP-binding protein [Promineifilum sp.]